MAFELLDLYDLILVIVGLVIFGAGLLPRYVEKLPLSRPILLIAFGFLVFWLPLGIPAPDPIAQGTMAERLTELGVILALMTAGLKLDRVPGLRTWESTWRLLAITMPLTIALAALLGWVVGLAVPTAVLLGAVIAPTDPVLASEVQVEGPGEATEEEPKPGVDGMRDEVRFALTSEAGLNDGLAFPFTNLAIAMAMLGVAPGNWFGEWALIDVGFRGLVTAVGAFGVGYVMARLVFVKEIEPTTTGAKSMLGVEVLGALFVVYGLTEFFGGYGFIAVFVAAVIIRNHRREHPYHEAFHDVSEQTDQLLMAAIMVLFGGLIAGGLFEPLTWELVAAALALVFVVRPVCGVVGLLGFDRRWSERLAISFYGLRGIGTFYYLAFALNTATFQDAEAIWALAGLTVLVSAVVHGVTATPLVEERLGDSEPELSDTPTG